jgi:HK97 gp10 family phage protein
MPMKGAKAHAARLRRLASPAAQREIGKALFAGGQAIAVEAQLSITRGAVSGRNHVPSKPGEAPKNDTGFLAGFIEANMAEPLVAEVGSLAPHSAPLEFGTSKMAARPFMRPAREKMRGEVSEMVRRAVEKIAKGGTI